MHLLSQAQGTVRWDAAACAFVPDRVPDGYSRCVGDGERGRGGAAAAPLWAVEPPPGRRWDECFVDQQRDATVADLHRAVGAGLRSPEHVKRFTTIGTASDQGRTSGVVALGVLADLIGTDIAELGPTTFRPPYTPVGFGLARRTRPRRAVGPGPHDRDPRVARGARRRLRGRRPVEAPVVLPARRRGHGRRRAARVRARRASRVAMMDASTLGKIDVQGPDARDLPQPPVHRATSPRSPSAGASTACCAAPTGWCSTTA